VFLYTARVAAISAVPAMLLGFLVAYLVSRHRFWGRRFVEFGSLLSFATPGTVMGVAYIFAFNTGPWLLTASATIIILALVFRNMPVAIRAAVAGLAQIDPSLEEASTMLRARSFTTLRRVLFPLLVNTLVTGLIFAFVSAMTAVSQVIFLVSPGNQLATVLLLGWVEQGQLGRAAAMGTILIVSMLFTILVVLAAGAAHQRARREGGTLMDNASTVIRGITPATVDLRGLVKRFGKDVWRSTTSTCSSSAASCSRCSARPAAARPPSCGSSPGSSGPPRARS
jgi:ABC-type Fe3+ transport system permease subunit